MGVAVATTSRVRLVYAALAAGMVGAVTIAAYLVVSLAVFFKTPPLPLFEWDSSNFIGIDAAIAEGWRAVPIGQSAHCLVSIAWAALFVVCARYWKPVLDHPLLSGIVLGVVAMFFMRYAIVPLGHAPLRPDAPAWFVDKLVAHTLFFGVPVAYTVRSMLRR